MSGLIRSSARSIASAVPAGTSSAGDRAWPARVARVLREVLEPRDLPFALDARGIVGVEAVDQPANAVANLEGEVRGRGPGQRADVVGRGASADESVGSLGFAHPEPDPILTSSARSSSWAWRSTEIAPESPITQTWL